MHSYATVTAVVARLAAAASLSSDDGYCLQRMDDDGDQSEPSALMEFVSPLLQEALGEHEGDISIERLRADPKRTQEACRAFAKALTKFVIM